MDAFLSALGLSKGATIGGFLGALVSLRFITTLSVWQRCATVFGGMLCAAYVTPLVMSAIDLNLRQEGAIAFLIGLFGMSFAAAVVTEIPSAIAKIKEKYL